jgi:hypothetical protein
MIRSMLSTTVTNDNFEKRKPIARDEEIRLRLQNVLNATGWFVEPEVQVEEGVVFLNGQVVTEELKRWAGDLARNTQDVVAVANRMEVPGPVAWDFRPAWAGMMNLWRDLLRSARRTSVLLRASNIAINKKHTISR